MTSPTLTKNTANIKKFTYPSAESALYFLEDVFERALIPFFLLGDVARSVVDNRDMAVTDPIEIGILRKHYTEYARSTLPMFLPPDAKIGRKNITFTWDSTPVSVRVIDDHFSFLQNTDQVFYKITTFKIPNPFEEYWTNRDTVK